MKEFHDPSLPQQIARDRYLLDRPQQAMKRLLEDFDELVHLATKNTKGFFDEVAFEDLLSIVEFGMKGLLKLAFNRQENDFFVKTFRDRVRKTVESFMRDVPHRFWIRLNQLAYAYSNIPRTKVLKPRIGVKTYIAGVATAVAATLGIVHEIPQHDQSVPQKLSAPLDNNDKYPSTIPVSISTSSSPNAVHGDFDSLYDTEQSALKRAEAALYVKIRAEKDKALQDFRHRWQEKLDAKNLDYFDFFLDAEANLTLALGQDVKNAAIEYGKLREKLRAELAALSDMEFLAEISSVFDSPHSDSRNSRSTFADAFSTSQPHDGEKPEPVGNCELRAKGRIALIQDLRPHLMPHIKLQILNKHLRPVYQPPGKSQVYGIDFGLEKIPKRELDRTVIVPPEDYFVRPLVEGKELDVAPKIKSKNSGRDYSDSLFGTKISGLADAYGRQPSDTSDNAWEAFEPVTTLAFATRALKPGDLTAVFVKYSDPYDDRFGLDFDTPTSFSEPDIASLKRFIDLKKLQLKNTQTGTLSPLIVPGDGSDGYSIAPREKDQLAQLLRPHQLESLVLPGFTAVSSPDFDQVLATQGDLHQLSIPDVQSLSPETIEAFTQIPELRYLVVNAHAITPDTFPAWKKYLDHAFKPMSSPSRNDVKSQAYSQQSNPTFLVNSTSDLDMLAQLLDQARKVGDVNVVAPFVTHLRSDVVNAFMRLHPDAVVLFPNLAELTLGELLQFSLKVPQKMMLIPKSFAKKVSGLTPFLYTQYGLPSDFDGLHLEPDSVSTKFSPRLIKREYLIRHGK